MHGDLLMLLAVLQMPQSCSTWIIGNDTLLRGGTIYEPARVYSWGIWSTRVFVARSNVAPKKINVKYTL